MKKILLFFNLVVLGFCVSIVKPFVIEKEDFIDIVPRCEFDLKHNEMNVDNPNYYVSTNFNMTSYFRYLNDYSAENDIGSCSYVSLIQVMSYYDTFYNDDIILEQYDRGKKNSQTLKEAIQTSPGVLRQDFFKSGTSSYYQFCHNTSAINLQSELIISGNFLNGVLTEKDEDGETVFSPSIDADDYQGLLNDFYKDDGIVKVNVIKNRTKDDFINIIKNKIDEGNPVIVDIYDKSNPNADGHAVVAYRYDDSGVYANYGWSAGYTDKLLLGRYLGYNLDTIYCVISLDYSKMGHKHSDNYIIKSKAYCGCNHNYDFGGELL